MITHFRQAIEETLPWLSSFGADPAGGMTRLLYSPEWLETQQQFKKRMAASGLETRFDEVGNLYGRLSGTEYPQQADIRVHTNGYHWCYSGEGHRHNHRQADPHKAADTDTLQ